MCLLARATRAFECAFNATQGGAPSTRLPHPPEQGRRSSGRIGAQSGMEMGSDSKFGVEGPDRTAGLDDLSHQSDTADDLDCANRDRSGLSLWLAQPDDFATDEVVAKYAPLLTEEERTRWQRLRYPRHRREYLATRALVRSALSHYRPLAPEEWRFQPNAHGKPATDPDCGLRFNLSNSLGLVVCLIGT